MMSFSCLRAKARRPCIASEKSARGTLSSPSPHSPCKPLGTTVPIIPSPSKRLQHNHVKTARHEGLSEQPTLEASSACIPSENDDGPGIAWISGPLGSAWMQMRAKARIPLQMIICLLYTSRAKLSGPIERTQVKPQRLLVSIASIASITAERKPFLSSAATPMIVVPPGEQTASFIAPGCAPVSSWSFAVPASIWEASE